ncbi:MAG: NADH-quinone oxidoreductase subunit N [archaeon]|nr:NADH-quinone oxidoreductase subunit N [archaeon]
MIDVIFHPYANNAVAAIVPMIVLIFGALLMPGLAFIKRSSKMLAFFAEIFIILSALTALVFFNEEIVYRELFVLNSFSVLMMLLFLTVAGLVVLISPSSSETTEHIGEYYSLILIATTGMLFAASSRNLLSVFVSVECVSISSYALVTLKKNDHRASEAGVKYLLVGGMSSALALYGISMLYGVTGTIEIPEIAAKLSSMTELTMPVIVAVVAIIAGYGFKVSAVPFHAWAPDVYEGASTPITTLLATASKKMGFVVLFEIFIVIFSLDCLVRSDIQAFFAIIAAVTMTVGNVVAISQKNIKRMLAYSSIAQAGYILIALAVMSNYALTGGLFHMITHVFMKGGAFIAVAALITAGIGENISDYRGLAKRSPLIAFAMLLFLFSLAGIPPLAGFTSKFVLFSGAIFVDGAVSTRWLWLVLVAVLNSAISLYYYTKVIKAMYIDAGDAGTELKIKRSHMIAVLVCAVLVVLIGVFPETLLNMCDQAALSLLA